MGVDNANIARRYMTEVWAKGDMAAADELVDKDIVLRDPLGTKPTEGIEKFKERVERFGKGFEQQVNTIDEVLVIGDLVVLRHTWHGVHRGEFYRIPGTGKTLMCQAVEFLRIQNGKVVENISYFDLYSMFEQLAVLPPPEHLRDPKPQPPPPAKRARA
jgi:steroid delta-isomerase-like uncharacterized protein